MISARCFNTSLALFPIRRALGVLCILLLAAGLLACRSSVDENGETNAPTVVDVTAVDYAFAAPDSIPSGWTTFKMTNEGEEHHLFVLAKVPEGKTSSDLQEEVYAPYDSLTSLLKEGTIDSTTYGKTLSRTIPDWYGEQVELEGGVSLTAPGRTAQTTVNLEPGTYAMECYAKTPEWRLHAARGMHRPLIVTTDSTGARPPEADLRVSLSKGRVQADLTVSPGGHTVAVRFGEKRKGSPFGYVLQHLHLARLDQETSAHDLAQWMKWDPIMPAPVEFVGGAEDMPTGHTA